MRKLRQQANYTIAATAKEYGCDTSHISRVERGSTPSRPLVQFYEERLEGDGLCHSLFEVAEQAAEQDRRRADGHRSELTHGSPGDASAFVDDTIPHGTLMTPSQRFVKTWRIRNSGCVPWRNRRLERQGPLTGWSHL
jgi:transcriptional regulator with XRE-family HTH domain